MTNISSIPHNKPEKNEHIITIFISEETEAYKDNMANQCVNKQ